MTLGLGPPKGASIDRLSGASASTGVLSSTLGVARTVWRQCWLCAGCAVSRAGCCVGGGVPCGGKHIIISMMIYTTCGMIIKLGLTRVVRGAWRAYCKGKGTLARTAAWQSDDQV